LSYNQTLKAFSFENNRSGLHKAVQFDKAEVVDLLLGVGKMNIHCIEGTFGDTPLHFAARFNAVKSVPKLLRAGADLFKKFAY
jgi:ankyrin repeat protein